MWTTFQSVRRVRWCRGLSRIAGPLLCVTAALCPAPAFAQASLPLELTWTGPEGCPSSSAVLARVREIAGSSRPSGAPLRAQASVTRLGDRAFRLRLGIQSGDLAAERVIDGRSCKDLGGAAAVTLALLLSSDEPLSERDLAGDEPPVAGGQERGSATGSPQSTATPVPSAPQQAPPAAQPETEDGAWQLGEGSERGTHGLLIAPLGALGIGPTGQTSRGLGLAAGLSLDSWRFLSEGKLWQAQHATLSNLGDQYAVELHRFSLSVRGCRGLWRARFELAPCALVSVQHLSARGSGPNLVSNTDTATWLSAGIGMQAQLLVTSWLALVAGIDGELQFSRPEVILRDVGLVERLAPAAATITVGSEWIF